MPTSDDNDLDDILRSAMKTLDDEAPSGYFEVLPVLTLTRLEGTMQHGPQGTMDEPVSPPPPVGDNTEDSGLHDIRNLASSTKQRLSSKKITRSPSESENDVIASSSAGWKAVALPQPAKMVSLPELAALPSKKEVLAKDKAPAKVAPEARVEAKPEAKVDEVAAAAVETPAPAPAKMPLAPQPAKSKTGLYAVVGVVVAAAAGAAIFVATRSSNTAAPKVAPNTPAPAAAAQTPTVTPIATGSAAVSPEVQKAQDEIAKQEAEAERMRAELAAAQAAAPAPTEAKAEPKTKTHAAAGGGEKVEAPVKKTEETKPAPEKPKELKKPDGAKAGDSGDPDFNELLKEAGVKEPQAKKPVLAKKELTGDDFKSGMAAITPAAKNCYKGTQGTAMVKIVIAPSGQVSKVTVSGQFSGTPEGDCVTSAIKSASFPPWDGGPQSFTYPILLSE